MPELADLSRREPLCPAARKIAGASTAMQGVVCCAMLQDVERADGTELGMNAGEYGFLQHEATAGVHLNLKSDPSTVIGLCYGSGLPVLSDVDHQARDHHSYCPVWQAEKQRLAAGADQLVQERQPEPVSMGMGEPAASHEAADPIAAGRAALEELAPTRRSGPWR